MSIQAWPNGRQALRGLPAVWLFWDFKRIVRILSNLLKEVSCMVKAKDGCQMGGVWYNVKVRVAAGRLGGRCQAEKKIGEAQGTMGERYHVLVVDDDREIVESIAIYLSRENLEIYRAYDGLQALEVLASNTIHLILLDVMMPKMDGIKAMLKIREQNNIPIILVSAKSEDTDKIFGLEFGADDYITKPFNPLELIARVKSQLRRYFTLGTAVDAGGTSEVLRCGGLELDVHQKQLKVDGEEVKLTPIEYKILELLLRNQGRVFSISEIYERVWNEPSFAPENTVAVHIRRIREKIEINPKEPKYLKVVWGIGFKIEKA